MSVQCSFKIYPVLFDYMLLRCLENHFSLYLINLVYCILLFYYFSWVTSHMCYIILIVSDIWKGQYYYALNVLTFCILLKCTHLKCLGKTLLLPFSSIFYRIKFLWNYIFLTLLVRILLFCFINVFHYSFVLIAWSQMSRKDCVTSP